MYGIAVEWGLLESCADQEDLAEARPMPARLILRETNRAEMPLDILWSAPFIFRNADLSPAIGGLAANRDLSP